MDIKDFDLNLLIVFNALMTTRSLTDAGRVLGRAQPTISHALGRLRAICGDPLFVRARNTLEPTPLAHQLAGPIAEALEIIQDGLSRSVQFDPETSQATFTILMSDIGQMTLLPKLVRHVHRAAPNVRIIAANAAGSAYADALQQGHADLAIGSLNQLKAGFMRQRLFGDTYTCMVAVGNETIGDRVSSEQYVSARHVGIVSPGHVEAEVERLLLPPGVSRRIAVRVPNYLAAPLQLPGTNLIATVPTRVLGAFAGAEQVRQVGLWLDFPMMDIYQYWHERVHNDRANRWMRGVVAELLSENGVVRG